MKSHLFYCLPLLLPLGCKKLSDQRIKTGSISSQAGEKQGSVAEEYDSTAAGKGAGSLLGTWGASCGTFNSPNKEGKELFARQTYEFIEGGKLVQSVPLFTNASCTKPASEEEIKGYLSGFELTAEEVDLQFKAISSTREEKTYTVAAVQEEGSLIEVNISAGEGSMLYTSIRIGANTISIAKECLQEMFDKKQCTELSGDSAERRAKQIDALATLNKIPL